jgi:hypothetical protein
MKRTAVAAAWLIGASVPLLASAVLLFGCCVLPFHNVIHKALPFCPMAIGILHPHHEPPSPPAQKMHEPVKRIATALPAVLRIAVRPHAWRLTAGNAVACRSFISLGAARCDDDVGVYLLAVTFLI